MRWLIYVGDRVLNDDDNNFIIPHRCLAIADLDILDEIYGNLIREKRYEELANSAIHWSAGCWDSNSWELLYS